MLKPCDAKLFLSVLVLAFASASTSLAQTEIEMFAPQETSEEPQVIGGVPAAPAQWPATYIFRSEIGLCTSTLIGPRVLVTAAHCIEDGARGRIRTNEGNYRFQCDHHPNYVENEQYDVALCITNSAFASSLQRPFETVNQDIAVPAIASTIRILGFGCRQEGGGGPAQSLYTGTTTVGDVEGIYIVTDEGAAVCYGDSGGAAYIEYSDISRRIIGVNSRGNISTTSYLTPTAVVGVANFFRSWAEANGVQICGIHSSTPGCRS